MACSFDCAHGWCDAGLVCRCDVGWEQTPEFDVLNPDGMVTVRLGENANATWQAGAQPWPCDAPEGMIQIINIILAVIAALGLAMAGKMYYFGDDKMRERILYRRWFIASCVPGVVMGVQRGILYPTNAYLGQDAVYTLAFALVSPLMSLNMSVDSEAQLQFFSKQYSRLVRTSRSQNLKLHAVRRMIMMSGWPLRLILSVEYCIWVAWVFVIPAKAFWSYLYFLIVYSLVWKLIAWTLVFIGLFYMYRQVDQFRISASDLRKSRDIVVCELLLSELRRQLYSYPFFCSSILGFHLAIFFEPRSFYLFKIILPIMTLLAYPGGIVQFVSEARNRSAMSGEDSSPYAVQMSAKVRQMSLKKAAVAPLTSNTKEMESAHESGRIESSIIETTREEL